LTISLALIGFLDRSRSLFPDKAQRFWFKVDILAEFRKLKHKIDSAIAESKAKSRASKRNIIFQSIDSYWKESEGAQPIDGLADGFHGRLLKEYVGEMSAAIVDVFGSEAELLNQEFHSRLQQVAANLYVRKNVDDYRVADIGGGVVICGFGEMEAFPSVLPFRCQRIILDKLLYRDEQGFRPSVEITPAAILPFAQTDVVFGFLRGVDPGFHRLVEGAFTQFVRGHSDIVLNEIAAFTGKPIPTGAQDQLKADLEKRYVESIKSISEGLAKYTNEKHVDPLLQVLSVAPKEELAVIAEALVSLTAIKRKMSLDWPTVGGPIDTAVISKGDGFVWISRKHYFNAKLNLTFAQKYFDQ